MGKVVTQEDLFAVLRGYEERLARLENAVYALSSQPTSFAAKAAEPPPPEEAS